MDTKRAKTCRCVCCDRDAFRVWLAMIAVLVAILFAAMAGALSGW